jgi:AcrR family transcriptional regulator
LALINFLIAPNSCVHLLKALFILNMAKSMKIDFSKTEQDRSKKTLDDLLASAYLLVKEANPEKFTSRELAEKSGYALGTLIKRLGSIENVFLWAIQKGQRKQFDCFIEIVSTFDENLPLNDLLEQIADATFASIKGVNPKVIRYFEDRLAKKNGFDPDFFNYSDVLVKPFIETVKRNKTNTFRELSETEGKLIFRSTLTFVERPFVEGNPIAGTKEHRRIVIENLTRLLGR